MTKLSNEPADRATGVIEFSDEFFAEISRRLDRVLQTWTGPKYAAFDADGTLWDRDAGETLFDWQIANCNLSLPVDPWKHYIDLKDPDPRIAYVWLAQISAGHSLAEVRHWALQCREAHRPWPVFDSTRKMISLLREKEIEVYIVTASVKWAVEPMAELIGVDHDHVLGITTEIENGFVTDRAVHPITWRQGKAEGFLTHTNGVKPLLAMGNTYGDSYLLQTAAVPIAVSTQAEYNSLFEEEAKLRVEAHQNCWLTHQFRKIP